MSEELSQMGDSPLPPLYARWLKDLLPGEIPAETEAPCRNCVMCKQPDSLLTPEDIIFDERVKCCTYIPRQPNFLVGGILADNDLARAAGKLSTEARLQRGIGVIPFGIERTAEERRQFEEMIAGDRFGREPGLCCPHFLESEGGICAIWRYRNAACTTFFCRHLRGDVGAKFWNVIKLLLTAAEDAAAQWCACRLELGEEALFNLYSMKTLSPQDAPTDESLRQRSWGPWWGRERDFFIECGRLITTLGWSDIIEIGGIELRTLADLTLHAYRQLTEPTIPSALRFGDFSAVALDPFSVRVWGTRRYQPIDLPSQFVEAPLFVMEGPAAEVIANIQKQTGARLSPYVLQRLLDLGILLPGLESEETKPGDATDNPE